MKLKHALPGEDCPSCEEKLKDAHPVIKEFFYASKKVYPDLHTSSVWRGEAEQAQFFKDGASELEFPHSKHNFVFAGQKMALAIDLFQQNQFGCGSWVRSVFESLWHNVANAGKFKGLMAWAGHWKGNFRESCHFELLMSDEIMDGKLDPDIIKF